MDEPTVGKITANLILNDLKALLKKEKLTIEQSPLKPELIGFFAKSIHSGALTKQQVKKLMTKFFYENLNEKE
jgi:Asp-tRNA(Asn)/Glu-tRNA(Gln) amidotransferase B subunit